MGILGERETSETKPICIAWYRRQDARILSDERKKDGDEQDSPISSIPG